MSGATRYAETSTDALPRAERCAVEACRARLFSASSRRRGLCMACAGRPESEREEIAARERAQAEAAERARVEQALAARSADREPEPGPDLPDLPREDWRRPMFERRGREGPAGVGGGDEPTHSAPSPAPAMAGPEEASTMGRAGRKPVVDWARATPKVVEALKGGSTLVEAARAARVERPALVSALNRGRTGRGGAETTALAQAVDAAIAERGAPLRPSGRPARAARPARPARAQAAPPPPESRAGDWVEFRSHESLPWDGYHLVIVALHSRGTSILGVSEFGDRVSHFDASGIAGCFRAPSKPLPHWLQALVDRESAALRDRAEKAEAAVVRELVFTRSACQERDAQLAISAREQKRADDAEAERDRERARATRYHRLWQQVSAALKRGLEAHGPGSLGRAAANIAARDAIARAEEAEAEVAALRERAEKVGSEVARLRASWAGVVQPA